MAPRGMSVNATNGARIAVKQCEQSGGRDMRSFTVEEVAAHNAPGDVWVAIRGKVYDVSKWVARHPGGPLPILDLGGKDATDPFIAFHPENVIDKMLPLFQIGVIKNYQKDELQEELIRIKEEITQNGLMESNYLWYLGKFIFQAVMFILALVLLAQARFYDSTLLYLASATALGLFWQQLSFLGHDFGHNSVTHDINKDWWGSIVVTMLLGVSGQWWKRSHNIHHLVTNSVEHDPDIQHLPVLAISEKIFPGFRSSYHNKFMSLDSISRFFVSYQHILYVPIMAVARFNLYAQSFLLVLNMQHNVRRRWFEVASLVAYWVWYSYLLSLLPDWPTLLYYMLISHSIAGIIHVQITLSHFAMETYSGVGFDIGDPHHFLRTQLATTMDVDCPWWMDWFHGGLQFQVIHHIIPRLPRHNLRYVRQKYIIPLAKKYNYKYHSYTFWDCMVKVHHQLRVAADAASRYPTKPMQNYLWQMLNAHG